MKLALGTSLLMLVVGGRAAPQAVYPGRAIALDTRSQRSPESLCRSGAADSTSPPADCLVLRKREDEPYTSTTPAMSVHTTSNLYSSSSSSNTIPLSSPKSTPSLHPTPSLIIINNLEARGSSPSNDQLRTIGIVGGFLAGVALVSILGIVLILVRNQRRARSSAASGSTRSRSRTHSRAQQPPAFMTRETSDSTFPIIRVPPPRIYTGPRAPTTVSGDVTSATAGHTGDMLQFPISPGQGSASSRTTSFGHHSESGGSGTPRRPPQIPSLGLSQARPFLRSVASAFSYHASAGHSSPIAQEVEVEIENDTSVTHGATTSLSGSRTAVTTEDTTRTAPVETSSEHSVKSSSH